MPAVYPLSSFRIGLLGAGRVASYLAPALVAAGHHVVFVWSRTEASAQALAIRLPGTHAITSLTALPLADVYLLALPDAVVSPVLAAAAWPVSALVAHLAGALPLQVFDHQPGIRGGVFYPLQTFSTGRTIDWSTVPLCIEAAEPDGQATLLALAYSLSQQVRLMVSSQRLLLHVAAVFASNFTNHLLGIADKLLAEATLPLTLIAPLVHETVDKALANAPFKVQTGPAARRDYSTLVAHQTALTDHPAWQKLYDELTASIQAQL